MSERKRGKEKNSGNGVMAVIAGIAVIAAINHYRGNDHSDEAVAKPKAPSHAVAAGYHFNRTPTINKLRNPLPNPKGNKQIDPLAITLHWWGHDGGGDIHNLEESLRTNHACGNHGCTVQFGITKTGDIYQMMRRPTDWAQHASGANPTSIGIEIEGSENDFDVKGSGFNRAKYEAVVSLTKYLMLHYKIPLNGPVVCEHPIGVHSHDQFNKCRDSDQAPKTDVGADYLNLVKTGILSMK